jgi:succinyl-CoA synthetase beta subunit
VNLEAVAQTLANLLRLAVGDPDIVELDVNPLMATSHGCFAVDARIVWRS